MRQRLQEIAMKSGKRINSNDSFFEDLIKNLILPFSDVDRLAANMLINGTYDDGTKVYGSRFKGPVIYFGTKLVTLGAIASGVYFTLEKILN